MDQDGNLCLLWILRRLVAPDAVRAGIRVLKPPHSACCSQVQVQVQVQVQAPTGIRAQVQVLQQVQIELFVQEHVHCYQYSSPRRETPLTQWPQ